MIKVKSYYWFWIVRYGGKKRIPPEVIFNQMAKSMARMSENVEKAVAIGHDHMGHDETMQSIELLRKVSELKKNINGLGR